MTNDQPPFDAPRPAPSPDDETRQLRPSIENRIQPTFMSDEAALPPPDQPVGAVARREEADSGGILWEITETLVLALLIFLAVRTVVLNFRVDGLSMEPTLDTGQMLLVNRQIYFHFDLNDVLNVLPFVERDGEHIIYPLHPPQRGDIIVFDPPISSSDKPYIKRVIGLPGETVELRDGVVYIDGKPLPEELAVDGGYLQDIDKDPFGPITVPEGEYFMLGDWRTNSGDSRFQMGTIPEEDITGRAFVLLWPPDRFRLLTGAEYPGFDE